MEKKSFLFGLTRNILILGIVSLFTDLSSQMVFPLIPLYLISLGASAWVVGLVEGAAETTSSLIKVVSGFWSDKIKKRKAFLFSGYGISSFTKPLFAFAQVWPLVLIVRVIERIGKGIRTAPRDALIAESCYAKIRGKAYGFHRALDGIGSILGALLAFILLPLLGFRNIFLIAVIPGIIAVIFILFIRETYRVNRPKINENVSLRVSIRNLPKNLKLFIFVAAIFAFGHFGYAFLLLKARNIGLDNGTTIFLYVLFYIVYTLLIIPAGMLSDKIGRKPIIMIGYGLFALISLALIFISHIYALVFIFILYGVFYSMIDGVQRAFVVDLAPAKLRATALGSFHTAIGLAALPGGFIAGFIWDQISPKATFIYAFLLAVSALILLILIKSNSKNKLK